jgi:S1-C subfamily serine protease
LVDPDPEVHSLQEFMDDGDNMSPLGIEVQETRWKIGSGKMADGLLIVGVTSGSAAARAGLHPYRRGPKELLEGVIVAGAMFFPPAALAVPIVESVKVGESADLIIAVDGFRVINFLDFEERMRDVQPGEIVYLTIVRDGVRMQMPVQVPATLPAPIF